MGEVIEEDRGILGREIGLIHPSVYTSNLSLNQPPVVQESALRDERV